MARLCKGIFDCLENTDVKPQKVEDNKPMFVPVDIRTLNDPCGKKYIYEQAIVIVEQLEKAGISRELVFISVCYFPRFREKTDS